MRGMNKCVLGGSAAWRASPNLFPPLRDFEFTVCHQSSGDSSRSHETWEGPSFRWDEEAPPPDAGRLSRNSEPSLRAFFPGPVWAAARGALPAGTHTPAPDTTQNTPAGASGSLRSGLQGGSGTRAPVLGHRHEAASSITQLH